MKIAIRTDASQFIGSGHIMRCKTLADKLQQHGAEIRFICRQYVGSLIQFLISNAHQVFVLPEPNSSRFSHGGHTGDHAMWLGVEQSDDAEQTIEALSDFKPDWLVVDHYGLDMVWERMLRPHVKSIMVIDDLANREHDCDLLLDQNLQSDMSMRYNGLTPAHAILLLGPQFALLRPEFQKAKLNIRERDGLVRRILVFFGGVDGTQQTEKVLATIRQLRQPEIKWDIVVGEQNPRAKVIELLCDELVNTNFHSQIANMAELMASADLAVGAGGGASWERCALGLPTILISTADNQLKTADALEQIGAAMNLGKSGDVTVKMLTEIIRHMLRSPERLRCMSRNAFNVSGGTGVDGTRALLDAMTFKVSNKNRRVN